MSTADEHAADSLLLIASVLTAAANPGCGASLRDLLVLLVLLVLVSAFLSRQWPLPVALVSSSIRCSRNLLLVVMSNKVCCSSKCFST